MTLLGKLAIGTVVLAATTGGLAATDNLPPAAQQAVSKVVSSIGIDIPAPDHVPEHVDLPDQTDGVEAPEAPELPDDLPDEASDTADAVVGTVFKGTSDPTDDGQGFGEDVAETASAGATVGTGSQADDSRR